MARETGQGGVERIARMTFLNVWTIIGVIIIVAVALRLMGTLSAVLLFLGVGSMTAFMASPIVNVLERRGVPRGIGALLGLAVVLICVALLFVIVIPLVVSQFIELLSDAPAQLAAFGSWLVQLESEYAVIEHLNDVVQFDTMLKAIGDIANDALAGLLSALRDGFFPMVNNIASTVFIVFLGLVLAFWLACDYPRINEEICRVLGEDKADDYRLMLAVCGRSVGGYLRSTAINSCIQGVMAGLAFTVVGHPYAGAMGVLSGVLNIIPVVGPSISAIIATSIAVIYSPAMAFWTLVGAVVSQNITDNVFAPRVNQSTMSVHPVLSLTALVIGSTVGGAAGMIVALPLAAVVKSLFIFYFESRSGQQIVSYDGALFRGTPFQDSQGKPVPAYDALGDDTFVADSQILDDAAAPKAEMLPNPHAELENPWVKLLDFDSTFGAHFRSPGDGSNSGSTAAGSDEPPAEGSSQDSFADKG